MQADKINYIVNKLHRLPYKCILFDGVWGIGKTYAINKALSGKKEHLQDFHVWITRKSTDIS